MTARDSRGARGRIWLAAAIILVLAAVAIAFAARHPSTITTPRTTPPAQGLQDS